MNMRRAMNSEGSLRSRRCGGRLETAPVGDSSRPSGSAPGASVFSACIRLPMPSASSERFESPRQLLAGLMESALEGVMVLEAVREGERIVDFAWQWANAPAAEAFGHSAEELAGRRLLAEAPALEAEGFFEDCARVADGAAPVRRRLEAEPLGGEGARVSVARMEGGAVVVTLDARADEAGALRALRESKARFRAVTENISDLVCLHDPDGTCVFATPSSRSVLGYPPRALEGGGPLALVHPDDAERIETALERTRRGERVTVQVRLHHFLTSTRDVTERVEAEQQIERTNATLRLRNRELEDFAHIASHDLQEPLRKVRAFAGLMREDYDEAVDETGRYYLDRMQDGAERMGRLVSDLLSLSRVTTRDTPFEQVALSDVAADVHADLEMRIADTGGRVEIGALPEVEADPTQMHRLLQNLVGNALKFHREGVPPVVRVHGERRDVAGCEADDFAPGVTEVVRLVVEDNGIGFEKKFLDRIFTPLQRLHARDEYAGTGIGLAVCRRITERHRGCIRAESTPGARYGAPRHGAVAAGGEGCNMLDTAELPR
ncbi:MAG: PAS domain-containing sensor histidine kinase [Bacteroidetes bacterium QH_2_67_10]|nr:MAG: PAS domain-containing sensor histidine kinase [Bacteroidetes bacterium QH_2_67_10]